MIGQEHSSAAAAQSEAIAEAAVQDMRESGQLPAAVPIWQHAGKAILPLGHSALRIQDVAGLPAVDINFHERRSGSTQFGYIYPPSKMSYAEVLRWAPREMLAVLEDLLPHLRAYVAAQEVDHA